jgi:hypothetical protein
MFLYQSIQIKIPPQFVPSGYLYYLYRYAVEFSSVY